MGRATAKRTHARGGGEADDLRWTRGAVIPGKRRRATAVGRRIRMLRELVPGCGGGAAEEMGIEGLFREAADYILHLQVQVKVMQMVLREFSPPAAQVDGGDGD